MKHKIINKLFLIILSSAICFRCANKGEEIKPQLSKEEATEAISKNAQDFNEIIEIEKEATLSTRNTLQIFHFLGKELYLTLNFKLYHMPTLPRYYFRSSLIFPFKEEQKESLAYLDQNNFEQLQMDSVIPGKQMSGHYAINGFKMVDNSLYSIMYCSEIAKWFNFNILKVSDSDLLRIDFPEKHDFSNTCNTLLGENNASFQVKKFKSEMVTINECNYVNTFEKIYELEYDMKVNDNVIYNYVFNMEAPNDQTSSSTYKIRFGNYQTDIEYKLDPLFYYSKLEESVNGNTFFKTESKIEYNQTLKNNCIRKRGLRGSFISKETLNHRYKDLEIVIEDFPSAYVQEIMTKYETDDMMQIDFELRNKVYLDSTVYKKHFKVYLQKKDGTKIADVEARNFNIFRPLEFLIVYKDGTTESFTKKTSDLLGIWYNLDKRKYIELQN